MFSLTADQSKESINPKRGTNLLSKVMFMDTLTSGEPIGTDTLNAMPFANNKPVQIEEAPHTRFNTQTRRDFADLEQVYRNLTTFNDSGLNTLIKSNFIETRGSNRASREDSDPLQSRNTADIGADTVNAIKTGNLKLFLSAF